MNKIILLILSTIAISACKTKIDKEELNTDKVEKYMTLTVEQIKSGNIKLEKIEERDFKGTIQVTGTIEVPPAQQSAVSTLMPGLLKKLALYEGQKVQKGQILFYVESQEFITLQQELATLNERLVYLKNDYERQTKLFNENANTEKKYIEATSEYKSNLATFNGLKKKLQLLGVNVEQVLNGDFYMSLPIYAPLSGSIKKIYGLNGSYINTPDKVLEIVNTNMPYLVLQVFDSQLASLKVNQNIEFSTSFGKTYTARIVNIGAAIDQNSKTIKVVAEVANGSGLIDGLPVNANIVVDSSKHKSINSNAVVSEDNKHYIYVLHHKDNGIYYFEKIPVVIAAKNEMWVAFENPELLENKEIITDGAISLTF